MRTVVICFVLAITLALNGGQAHAGEPPLLRSPVSGAVLNGFSVGAANWNPGHRGVDLAAAAGEPVRASASGIVHYAGTLAGRGVVSIRHGMWRTTYEPVTPVVAAGTPVETGQVIGHVAVGHASCAPAVCLHWGLTDGTQYRNPLTHSPTDGIRLLPTDTEIPASAAPMPGSAVRNPSSILLWPAHGKPGSPFGMRMHPILGYRRMHWGVDVGAACGSPLYAAGNGRVSRKVFSTGYGHYLKLDLGTINGTHLVVGYAHAQRYVVNVGDIVKKGQVVGFVGTTGLSTGCHLHLELEANGRKINPMIWF